MCIATPLDRKSIDRVQKTAYLGNGTGDRPQTLSKVSSNEVLLINFVTNPATCLCEAY